MTRPVYQTVLKPVHYCRSHQEVVDLGRLRLGLVAGDFADLKGVEFLVPVKEDPEAAIAVLEGSPATCSGATRAQCHPSSFTKYSPSSRATKRATTTLLT